MICLYGYKFHEFFLFFSFFCFFLSLSLSFVTIFFLPLPLCISSPYYHHTRLRTENKFFKHFVQTHTTITCHTGKDNPAMKCGDFVKKGTLPLANTCAGLEYWRVVSIYYIVFSFEKNKKLRKHGIKYCKLMKGKPKRKRKINIRRVHPTIVHDCRITEIHV